MVLASMSGCQSLRFQLSINLAVLTLLPAMAIQGVLQFLSCACVPHMCLLAACCFIFLITQDPPSLLCEDNHLSVTIFHLLNNP